MFRSTKISAAESNFRSRAHHDDESQLSFKQKKTQSTDTAHIFGKVVTPLILSYEQLFLLIARMVAFGLSYLAIAGIDPSPAHFTAPTNAADVEAALAAAVECMQVCSGGDNNTGCMRMVFKCVVIALCVQATSVCVEFVCIYFNYLSHIKSYRSDTFQTLYQVVSVCVSPASFVCFVATVLVFSGTSSNNMCNNNINLFTWCVCVGNLITIAQLCMCILRHIPETRLWSISLATVNFVINGSVHRHKSTNILEDMLMSNGGILTLTRRTFCVAVCVCALVGELCVLQYVFANSYLLPHGGGDSAGGMGIFMKQKLSQPLASSSSVGEYVGDYQHDRGDIGVDSSSFSTNYYNNDANDYYQYYSTGGEGDDFPFAMPEMHATHIDSSSIVGMRIAGYYASIGLFALCVILCISSVVRQTLLEWEMAAHTHAHGHAHGNHNNRKKNNNNSSSSAATCGRWVNSCLSACGLDESPDDTQTPPTVSPPAPVPAPAPTPVQPPSPSKPANTSRNKSNHSSNKSSSKSFYRRLTSYFTQGSLLTPQQLPPLEAWILIVCVTNLIIMCAFGPVLVIADIQNFLLAKSIVWTISGAIVAGLFSRSLCVDFYNMVDENNAKKSFISYISHEIRGPVSNTQLGLDLMLNSLQGPSANHMTKEEIVDILKDLRCTAEVAHNTLNDILLFDKIKSNLFTLDVESVRGYEFVMTAIKPFRIQSQSQSIHLRCATKGSDLRKLRLRIDPHKTTQVIRNLLSNALKFTPSGGQITVQISKQEEFSDPDKPLIVDEVDWKGVFRVAVVDSGAGISKENMPRLFGQYVQFNAGKLQGGKGSGLGLWLSKIIVEMHGGIMGASSEGEGKGCTFFFELPYTDSHIPQIRKSLSRSNQPNWLTRSSQDLDANEHGEDSGVDSRQRRMSSENSHTVAHSITGYGHGHQSNAHGHHGSGHHRPPVPSIPVHTSSMRGSFTPGVGGVVMTSGRAGNPNYIVGNGQVSRRSYTSSSSQHSHRQSPPISTDAIVSIHQGDIEEGPDVGAACDPAGDYYGSRRQSTTEQSSSGQDANHHTKKSASPLFMLQQQQHQLHNNYLNEPPTPQTDGAYAFFPAGSGANQLGSDSKDSEKSGASGCGPLGAMGRPLACVFPTIVSNSFDDSDCTSKNRTTTDSSKTVDQYPLVRASQHSMHGGLLSSVGEEQCSSAQRSPRYSTNTHTDGTHTETINNNFDNNSVPGSGSLGLLPPRTPPLPDSNNNNNNNHDSSSSTTNNNNTGPPRTQRVSPAGSNAFSGGPPGSPMSRAVLRQLSTAWQMGDGDGDLSATSHSSHAHHGINIKDVKLRFLVVDDALVSRKLVTRLLQPVARQIVTAENGAIAVQIVQEGIMRHEYFDVVLIDFNMPVMNGYEAIAHMRDMPRFDGFIIGVTAGGNDEKLAFLDAGADAVVQKPLSLEALQAAISVPTDENF